ncbi:MAG: cardiolipin synthase [Ruminococcaceae bacterium]|nr:cardiolipin synthase [Oscillospiraceae bacterium]
MKKLLYFLCHRSVIVAVSLLAQIAVLVLMIVRFSESFTQFYWICILVSFLAAIGIVSSRSDPAYKIVWLVLILPFPVFGGMIYMLFGGNRHPRWLQRAMHVVDEKMLHILKGDFKADTLLKVGEDAAFQARYLERRAHCPVYDGSRAEYFSIGEACYERMLQELKKAQRYIFLEYFIIQEGRMWDGILKILKEKAAKGVDVRVMYDDMGCMFTLSKDYREKLEEMGIRCCVFNRFVPVMSLLLNNRDHRKMCVIDGTVAFTGGINLADEYINQREKYGHWKDSGLMVEGDAAWSMAVMFLTLWDRAVKADEDYEAFRPEKFSVPDAAGYIQPYTDSPLDDEAVGHTVYLNMISKAEKYIYITTPYLILDTATNTALCNAAKAGVDVRIIVPHIPDKKSVFHVTRAHYPPLLEAGVKIYEYTPGFIHAKNFVVDDQFATVGTVNLDFRSLFLHFENGVWMCQTPCIQDIREDFIQTQKKSEKISLRRSRRLNLLVQFHRSVLRMFAPLM